MPGQGLSDLWGTDYLAMGIIKIPVDSCAAPKSIENITGKMIGRF